MSYLLSQKNIYEAYSDSPGETEDNTENIKRFDTGISFIARLQVPISKSMEFDIAIRDYLGLLNASKIKVIDDGSIKTNSLGLQLGLKYKL